MPTTRKKHLERARDRATKKPSKAAKPNDVHNTSGIGGDGKALLSAAHPGTEPALAVCGNCRHWRVRPNYRPVGECLPSRAGGPSPLLTLDMASCSAWEPRET